MSWPDGSPIKLRHAEYHALQEIADFEEDRHDERYKRTRNDLKERLLDSNPSATTEQVIAFIEGQRHWHQHMRRPAQKALNATQIAHDARESHTMDYVGHFNSRIALERHLDAIDTMRSSVDSLDRQLRSHETQGYVCERTNGPKLGLLT